MILIVGDKPSTKNIDPNIPFVGTTSYKRLLDWIFEMNIDISEVQLANIVHLDIEPRFNMATTHAGTFEYDAVIALGSVASERLKRYGVHHYKLPHPSGLNRKLNNKDFIKAELKECKHFLKSLDVVC